MFDTEFRIRRHDGAYRWFKTRAVPQLGPDGTIQRWFGTNTDIQDLKDAQESAARSSERRLTTLTLQLETAQRITQVGSWELEVASGEVVWSEELFRIFRLPNDGRPPTYQTQANLFAPTSWARLTEAISRSIERGEGYELELDAITSDGEVLRTVARAEAIRGPDGRAHRLVGTFQDISQRERTRERLRLLSERLGLATSAARIGVWEWNVLTGELTWDDTMFGLYGVADVGQQVTFDLWKSKLHPADADAVLAEVGQALRSGRRLDSAFRIVHAQAEVRHLKVAAVVGLDAAGQATRMVGVNWDFTEQRNAELALRERDAFQQALLEHAGPAVIATDLQGTITLFNRSAEVLLGYQASELVGRATPAVFHDEVEVRASKDRLERELGAEIPSLFEVFVVRARAGGVETREWTYVRKDGRRVPVLLTASAVRDATGTNIGFLGVAIDLTERKEQERALLELNALLEERSRQKEVLLQEVHHRVKNNLQVIASLVSMQARQVDHAAARAALAECRSRIDTIAMIHEQLYQAADYSRIPFSTYCRQLASNVHRAAGEGAGRVRLSVEVEQVALAVEHAIPLGLILNELLTNAFKHAFPEGRAGAVRVSLRDAEGRVVLGVEDDGVGIGPKPETRRESLGLQLVQDLTGQIEAEFNRVEIPQGTRFEVSLRRTRETVS